MGYKYVLSDRNCYSQLLYESHKLNLEGQLHSSRIKFTEPQKTSMSIQTPFHHSVEPWTSKEDGDALFRGRSRRKNLTFGIQNNFSKWMNEFKNILLEMATASNRYTF